MKTIFENLLRHATDTDTGMQSIETTRLTFQSGTPAATLVLHLERLNLIRLTALFTSTSWKIWVVFLLKYYTVITVIIYGVNTV